MGIVLLQEIAGRFFSCFSEYLKGVKISIVTYNLLLNSINMKYEE